MLTHTTFYDVLSIEDPGFYRSEALAADIARVLDDSDEHSMVCVAALANLMISYLRIAPPPEGVRIRMIESLLTDIRSRCNFEEC